ncbi:hypothetical protein ASE06_07750 [Sphingopyxis sp. Root214]|nr:hypothetical protein ASD73_00240 [Sphingopyxis sp. Root154]KRC09708.1 hypothetical protein ASE06_07750 [Sphingopyxis sp. Root214]
MQDQVEADATLIARNRGGERVAQLRRNRARYALRDRFRVHIDYPYRIAEHCTDALCKIADAATDIDDDTIIKRAGQFSEIAGLILNELVMVEFGDLAWRKFLLKFHSHRRK